MHNMSRYHKAASDGYLDLLKEATRKDLNTPDEDGMTPTNWAAFHGQLDALQLICSRGGDPDRCDIWGNTPLHHAASNGHMNILRFLVNFGANIFSLDNDFHCAMDVAASRERMDCVRFLDEAASQQSLQNPKKVSRLKEQASREAERRVKVCEKVKKRHQNRMDKMYRAGSGSEASVGFASAGGTVSNVSEQFSKLIASDVSGSLTSRVKGTLQRKFGWKDMGTIERQGDRNVIFIKQENEFSGKPDFVDVFNENYELEEDDDRMDGHEDDDDSIGHENKESIFKRPGLGNMVFRKNFSLEMGVEPDYVPRNTTEDLGFRIREEVFQSDLEVSEVDVPWTEEDIGLDEDDAETSPLDAFLASLSLDDFVHVFNREQLDLEALMLCSDDDLKGIRIQLGPRKKILEALAHRKKVLGKLGIMVDSML